MTNSLPFKLSFDGGELFVLTDGSVSWDASLLVGASDEMLALTLGHPGRAATWSMAYNAFLVTVDGKRQLIDAGAGVTARDCPGHRDLGQVTRRLGQLGVDLEEICDVFITHAHFDHVGGLVESGFVQFPNAMVHMNVNEVSDQSRLPEELEPYASAGRLDLFEDGASFGAVTSLPLHGHTPGHTGYLVGGPGRRVLFVGDLVHCATVQFPYPDAYGGSDDDPNRANAARWQVLGLSDGEDIWLAGAHFPDRDADDRIE